MEQLLTLVGQMYDAALDPSLWPDVLARVGDFCDASQAALVAENAEDPRETVFYSSIDAPDWVARYVESYMLVNPMRLAMVASAEAGDIILTGDFMTPQEYGSTPFAKGWLAEKNLVDVAVAVLEKSATCITVLSAVRGAEQGFADETVRRKLALLAPHAHRAVKIGQLLERKTLEAGTLADTLDTLSAAVVLVDAFGTILHANTQAGKVLYDDNITRNTPTRLTLHDRAAATALAQAIASAARSDAVSSDNGVVIAVTARDGGRHIATVMPLLAGRRKPIASMYRAVAAVCLKPATFELPAAASTLGAHYGLTRRELTILVAAVELGGIADVAAALGIAEATVRSHLKAIYQKTGATRQADLVKLVAGTASPVATGTRQG